jgi:hypothetical protein
VEAATAKRKESARLVLSEQDRLRSLLGSEASSSDPASSLSEVSPKSSNGSRREELERGREDAAAVSPSLDSDNAAKGWLKVVQRQRFARGHW